MDMCFDSLVLGYTRIVNNLIACDLESKLVMKSQEDNFRCAIVQ